MNNKNEHQTDKLSSTDKDNATKEIHSDKDPTNDRNNDLADELAEISSLIKEDRLTAEKKERLIATVTKVEQFSGLVPSPKIMEAFEGLYPGAIQMFFDHADKQVKHRLEIEKQQSQAEIRRLDQNAKLLNKQLDAQKRANIFGFSIAIMAMVAVVILQILEADWKLSAAVVGIPVMGVAQSLIKHQLQIREEKNN